MSIIEITPPGVINFRDGYFTGASGGGGVTFPGSMTHIPPDTHFWRVPPITPLTSNLREAAQRINKRIVYVNGIQTFSQGHGNTVKLISVITGADVCGVYNRTGDGRERAVSENTEMVLSIVSPQMGLAARGVNLLHTIDGFLADLAQCIDDKLLQVQNNPATLTLARAVFEACLNNVPINIIAHSQGGIITSGAIRVAISALAIVYSREETANRSNGFWQTLHDMSIFGQVERLNRMRRIKRRVEDTMRSLVSVQTFGGAANFYPNGPLYRHVNNGWDPVSNAVGQGSFIHGGGRDARQVQIERNSGMRIRDTADHSIDAVYLQSSDRYVDRTGNRADTNYVPIDMSMIR